MQNKATLKIIILSIIFFLMLGGYLIWETVSGKNKSQIVSEEKIESHIEKLEIVPSEKSSEDISFQDGAKAVVEGFNLSNVEFRQRGGGQIYTSPEGGLVGNGVKITAEDGKERWESAPLPTGRLFIQLCAIGFDFKNNKVGEVCLSNIKGLTKEEAQQIEQKAENKILLDRCLADIEEKYNKISNNYFDSCIQKSDQSDAAIMSCMEWAYVKERELEPQVKSSENACYKKYPADL